MIERFPFIFGTQYYRAPTPEPDCWSADMQALEDLGLNACKFFVQWRWSHRAADRFYFEDLDRLMDLAAEHHLGVTLNLLLDVSPVWLFERYPDAKQVDARGHTIEPYAVGHRQIGGHPGPCYRHPGALAQRRRFVEEAVAHFRGHPALQMWDVWNEPELCYPQRTPDLRTLACYCPHCAAGFRDWLQQKYGDLNRLNTVWGRCYQEWREVELPRDGGTITDFVDWREFHLDTLAEEARWRLDVVRQLDPAHGRYLHVVPNSFFSAVTCADDFAMAEPCEVFAATMTGGPTACAHVISAARGKACYNVESHINHGSVDMHQPIVDLTRLKRDLLPQFGLGVKGVLYWQYRSETLGAESPSWGLVRTVGTARPVTAAVREFWATLGPHAPALRRAFPKPPEIGIWRSRKNEIFSFCTRGQVTAHNAAIDAWIQALYWDNLPCTLINDGMLARGELQGIKLLILPCPYYLTQAEADALDSWVRAGGVLLSEAHLAGYNATSGRHSRVLPGAGLAASWGFRESESTAPVHLAWGAGEGLAVGALSDDQRKALQAYGAAGGETFPIRLNDGSLIGGAHRYAELDGAALEMLGTADGTHACIARTAVGQGTVIYCGTNLGEAAGAAGDASGLRPLLALATAAAGLHPTGGLAPELPGTVHLDLLYEGATPRYAVLVSRAERAQRVTIDAQGRWTDLFSGTTWELRGETALTVEPNSAEIYVIESGER
ncbi:MAG: hypothetical protein GX557_10540 [Chloroflexi bacterium]|nr:hypothetical protein [Chloroflexota bacterium]